MALYVVATPIGNMEDITLRAIRTLREVDLIAAEDTRKTALLLSHYEIKTPMTSYYEHNKLAKLDYILGMAAEKDLALVSEAGMPGISDPGFELIREAAARGIRIVPIPGPSAVITAVAASGLPTDQFVYLGFLPRRAGPRRRFLESVARETRTLVAFEAPHRIRDTLESILLSLGNRRIAACREITKLHEEIFRGTVQQAIDHFQEPRGEFTLVLEGAALETETLSLEEAVAMLKDLREQGLGARDAAARVAEASGLSRKELYKLWLKQA